MEIKMKLSVNSLKRNLIYVFLYICYYPSFITRIVEVPYWGGVCNLAIIFSGLYFFMNLIRTRRTNAYIYISVVFFALLNVSTLLSGNGEAFSMSNTRMIKCICFVLTTEYLLQKYDPRKSISVLMFVMEVLNYANLISMFIYPNGMYHTEWVNGMDIAVKSTSNYVRTTDRVHWLMGHQSTTIRYVLPAICVAILFSVITNSEKKKRVPLNIRSLVLIIGCVMEVVISGSGGNYIILLFFVALLFIMRKSNFIKTWWVIGGTFIFYSISSILSQTSFFNIIGLIVHRSVDLISRCKTWLSVVEAWTQKPIMGYGYINETSYMTRNLMNNYGNPHSDYLWVLFEGGLIAIVVFVILLIAIGKKAEKRTSLSAKVIFTSFICLMIMMLDDDHIFRSQYTMILFSLCYHIPSIDQFILCRTQKKY